MEADLDSSGRLNYEEFHRIMRGPPKNLSRKERERAEQAKVKAHRKADRRASNQDAVMAHLRAAPRWDGGSKDQQLGAKWEPDGIVVLMLSKWASAYS